MSFNRWINREAELFEVNGTEPSVFPEQISVRMLWINAEKSVQKVYSTKLLELTASNFMHALGVLVEGGHDTAAFAKYIFREALLFSVPINTTNLGSIAHGYVPDIASRFSRIITAEQLEGLGGGAACPSLLMYSPQVMHDCMCIWIFYHEPSPPPISLELVPGLAKTISALRPGRRTQRRTL
jgi:hypothetical protein